MMFTVFRSRLDQANVVAYREIAAPLRLVWKRV